MFQFHFGSIGSTDNNAIDYQTEVSIPLWFDWKQKFQVLEKKVKRFNSTLVRLEEKAYLLTIKSQIRFNSTLVRLEARAGQAI